MGQGQEVHARRLINQLMQSVSEMNVFLEGREHKPFCYHNDLLLKISSSHLVDIIVSYISVYILILRISRQQTLTGEKSLQRW